MSQIVEQLISKYAEDGAKLRLEYFKANTGMVKDVALAMALCLARGGKILCCGNGGSAADAQHFAGELVNRFLLERPPLPAIALTTDTSVLTAIANDYDFDQVFRKQVQALGNPGDVLLAISTSGSSPNVVEALKAAKEQTMVTVGMTGHGGGEVRRLSDYALHVADDNTPLVQEVHEAVIHLLCRLIDYYLFEAVLELQPHLDNGDSTATESLDDPS